MGGNNSYNKTLDRVRGSKKTHQEFHHRIDGHKILLQNRCKRQVKVPVNSNSESPIYLCGRKRKDGSVEISSIGIYKDHKCVGQIDLVFDSKGDLVPFANNGKDTSHYHNFSQNAETSKISRKSGEKKNHHPIDSMYDGLIKKIVEYNKSHRK